MAKKMRFIPKLKPERAFDVVRTNTSAYGMLYSVRTYFGIYKTILFLLKYNTIVLIFLFNRSPPSNLNWA